MVLLNSRITWFEETHLTYKFVNAFFELCLIFFMENCRKKLSLIKFDIRTSYVFIRLNLPVFFFDAVSCTKTVEHDWKKLNMNDNGKIRLILKMTFKLYKDNPFYLQNSFSKKKNWDSTFSKKEELYVSCLSKRSKSRLPRSWR